MSSFTLDDFKAGSQESQTPTPAPETAPEAATPEATPAESPSQAQPVPAGEPASSPVAQYTPDFTYEVKGEKKQFPEWLKTVIKSKEHESHLKDLYTKADGIEAVKESRSKVEQEYQGYKQKLEPVIGRVQEFDYHIQTKNFAEAFKLAGIQTKDVVDSLFVNDESVRSIELKLAQYYKALEQGPQAVNAFQGQIKNTQESLKLSTDLTQAQQQTQALQAQIMEFQLDQALTPHKSIMDSYDAQKGAGSFKQFVKMIGHGQWQQGKQMQPADLVSYVVGAFNLSPQATQAPTAQSINTNPAAQPVAAKPVIPNLGTGSNQSNVGKVANTMEAYRAQLKERAAA